MNIFENPRSVMIVSKQQEPGLILFTRELSRHLLETQKSKEKNRLIVYEYFSLLIFLGMLMMNIDQHLLLDTLNC